MLPSKMIPEVKNQKGHMLKPKTIKTTAATTPARKKARITSGTEVKDTAVRSATISPASSFQVSYPVLVKVRNVS